MIGGSVVMNIIVKCCCKQYGDFC